MKANRKKGIMLEIKSAPQGAWFSHNGVMVGLSIRPDSQMLYCHTESKQEQLVHMWNYRLLIERILAPMNLKIKQVHPDSIRAVVALHDALVAEHIPPIAQVLLKAQVKAGFRAYQPINAKIAAMLDVNVIKDVQQWKVAAAILRNCLSFSHRSKLADSASRYLDKINAPMLEWLQSLSDTEKPYKALSSSVMKGKNIRWIGKVPENIQNLSEIRLEQPLHSMNIRLLMAIQNLSQIADTEKKAWMHIVQHSSAADIRQILNLPQIRENRHTREEGADPRYQSLTTYLKDGLGLEESFLEQRLHRNLAESEKPTYAHAKSLWDMYNRSYRAHEEESMFRQRQQAIDAEMRRKSQAEWMKTKTAALPFRLPEFDEKSEGRFYFLDSVDAIYAEADKMQHCIARLYSKPAVNGECYLFHVEYKGHMASAELTPTGHVNQIKGINNNQNPACQWGRDALAEWVRNWEKYRIVEETEDVKA